MKRLITLGLLVTACYLFFLVQQCPVARVLPCLPLPPELTLSGARGTLWQGEFDLISWQGKVLQNVGWQLPVSSLLLFDPVVQLQFNDKETLRGQAELGWSGGVRLRDVDLQADAAWLLSQAPVRLPVSVPVPAAWMITGPQTRPASAPSAVRSGTTPKTVMALLTVVKRNSPVSP